MRSRLAAERAETQAEAKATELAAKIDAEKLATEAQLEGARRQRHGDVHHHAAVRRRRGGGPASAAARRSPRPPSRSRTARSRRRSRSPRGFAILSLASESPARMPALAEVEAKVRPAALRAKAGELALARLTQARGAVASGKSFADVAKELAVEVQGERRVRPRRQHRGPRRFPRPDLRRARRQGRRRRHAGAHRAGRGALRDHRRARASTPPPSPPSAPRPGRRSSATRSIACWARSSNSASARRRCSTTSRCSSSSACSATRRRAPSPRAERRAAGGDKLPAMRFETLAVHAGGEADRETGAVTPPIHLSTTFLHGPECEPLHDWAYQREGNPTQDRLEEALAAIEGGGPSSSALAFASGMAAAAALLQSLPAGVRVLFHTDIYSGVRQLALDFLPRWGIEPVFVDLADAGATAAALGAPGLAPALRLGRDTDQSAARDPRSPPPRRSGARCRRPAPGRRHLRDPRAAAAAGSRCRHRPALDHQVHGRPQRRARRRPGFRRHRDGLAEAVGKTRRRLGGTASPFSSWLILRGLRSLACRMERHSANALALAKALSGHPALSQVLYPGLPSHPGHEIAARQMTAFGGMLALRVEGGRAAAVAVAARLETVRQRHQPGRSGEPGRAPRLERRPGNDHAGRPAAAVDRPRAPGRPPRRPPAGARRHPAGLMRSLLRAGARG